MVGESGKCLNQMPFNRQIRPFMINWSKLPNAQLLTHGANVGLPDGQMGNSEVGHINLGAGRIVYQDLVKINKAIQDRQLETNAEFVKLIEYCNSNQNPVT